MSASQRLCAFPGCHRPVFSNGQQSFDCCGRTHAQEMAKLRQQQAAAPPPPQQQHQQHAPPVNAAVHLVPRSDPRFDSLVSQFTQKWTKKEYGEPEVVSIVHIEAAAAMSARYKAYRQSLIARQPPIRVHGSGGPGNEQRRFHGTTQKCQLGLGSSAALCSASDCAVCGIIRNGFLVRKAQSNISFARFGAGTYFTATSSKAHDYNFRSEQGLGNGLRSTLVCKVMVGNGYRSQSGDSNLTAPPQGYDSVLGETGTELNYDELIIYADDASLPAYLVVYKIKPGTATAAASKPMFLVSN